MNSGEEKGTNHTAQTFKIFSNLYYLLVQNIPPPILKKKTSNQLKFPKKSLTIQISLCTMKYSHPVLQPVVQRTITGRGNAAQFKLRNMIASSLHRIGQK